MNIYIIGVATAGKSTLVKMIKTRMRRVNVVSFEAVRNGFMKVLPELEMQRRESKARREILPHFLVEMAEWNEKMTGDLTIVEGSFAGAKQVLDLVRKEDLVVCLGYGGRSLEEVAERAIREACEGHYLYGKSEEEFKRHFYDLVRDDQANLEFCEEFNVPYFDTYGASAEEREEKLEEVVGIVMGWVEERKG